MSDDSPYMYALTADHDKPLREARKEIERLTAERDQARREVCALTDHGYMADDDYAILRGWDCFKGEDSQ